MNRISKPPEIRRRELLEAAAELFLRKGYEATSIRDILAKVGGQPAMFYYYFASKAEIFRAAMDAYTEGYVQGVVTILARRDRPVAARFREALDLAVKSLAKFNVAIDQGASVDRVGLADRYCMDFMNRLVEPSAALLREADPAQGEEETRAQARFFLYGVYGPDARPAARRERSGPEPCGGKRASAGRPYSGLSGRTMERSMKMPKNIIYCWSGTGNSLFDAKGIAAGLEGETHILPMRGAAAKDADTVGFVFPTYYWTIPAPVEEYIREAELPGGAYYYAVATCGAIPGNALAELNALLEEKGLALSCHAVHLHVANYVTIYEPFPDPARRVPQAAERLVPIAADIAARRVMAPPRRRVPRFFQRFFHAATSWGDYGKSYDKGYHISEACVSCGLCERLCAVKNITMERGRPVFHHNCEHCMACIQYCPQKAVNYKNATQKRSRYHHPSVPAAELEKLLNA